MSRPITTGGQEGIGRVVQVLDAVVVCHFSDEPQAVVAGAGVEDTATGEVTEHTVTGHSLKGRLDTAVLRDSFNKQDPTAMGTGFVVGVAVAVTDTGHSPKGRHERLAAAGVMDRISRQDPTARGTEFVVDVAESWTLTGREEPWPLTVETAFRRYSDGLTDVHLFPCSPSVPTLYSPVSLSLYRLRLSFFSSGGVRWPVEALLCTAATLSNSTRSHFYFTHLKPLLPVRWLQCAGARGAGRGRSVRAGRGRGRGPGFFLAGLLIEVATPTPPLVTCSLLRLDTTKPIPAPTHGEQAKYIYDLIQSTGEPGASSYELFTVLVHLLMAVKWVLDDLAYVLFLLLQRLEYLAESSRLLQELYYSPILLLHLLPLGYRPYELLLRGRDGRLV
ncbi:hypothetical protein BYT27DRAFT_7209286 [Phlegmacium glaucopus]|nr:hypothetical protein BYT27DRAFT_7209286 [Phlegmacium glaucopus]